MYLGIDVAASSLHCVTIGDDADVADARVVDSTAIGAVAQEFRSVRVVAIDAPSAISKRPHLN
jgi:hypothetical protein